MTKQLPEGYGDAYAEMLRLAKTFDGLAPPDRMDQWKSFDAFIARLAEAGWDRGDIYRLVKDVLKNESHDLSEEAQEALYDFETGLIGHCGYDSIVRLPGEPTGEDEFLHYVHGKKWMKER
jgi:hypothetical protein